VAGVARALAISNGMIHIVGNMSNGNAVHWSKGLMDPIVYFDGNFKPGYNAEPRAICVDGVTIYAVGRTSSAALWYDNDLTEVTGYASGCAFGVCVINHEIFVVGYVANGFSDPDSAGFWKNLNPSYIWNSFSSLNTSSVGSIYASQAFCVFHYDP
jgi:hypothetical protein